MSISAADLGGFQPSISVAEAREAVCIQGTNRIKGLKVDLKTHQIVGIYDMIQKEKDLK